MKNIIDGLSSYTALENANKAKQQQVLIVLQETAKRVDYRIQATRNKAANLSKLTAGIKADMPAILADIIELANSNNQKFSGKYDRAAAMADALKADKNLLKAWVETCNGRIPHKFTTNKLGQVVLSKRDAALVLSAEQLAALEIKKEQNKAGNQVKAARTKQTLQAKADSADQFKSLAEIERKAKEQAINNALQAEAKLTKAKDTLALAESKELELKELSSIKVKAERLEFEIKQQNEEIERLKLMETAYKQLLTDHNQLKDKNLQLLGMVATLQEENGQLKALAVKPKQARTRKTA